jgi:hypothetical protein
LSWGSVSLTADVTGTLPVNRGGTNSAVALNNNRIMVSSGGAVVEAGALTNGQLLVGSTGAAPVATAITAGSGITVTNGAGSITIAATGGGGSVTSVGLSLPGIFTVSGSPVTTTGTLTGTLATQTANTIWAGPTSGGAVAPTFRAIVAADISEKIALADLTDVTAKSGTGTTVLMSGSPTITTPTIADFTNATHTHQSTATGGTLNASAIAAGTLPIARGGTNSAVALNNNRIMVSSGGAVVEAGALTNGQLLIGSTGAAPVAAAITAGSGITVTNGVGSITIAASTNATAPIGLFQGRLTFSTTDPVAIDGWSNRTAVNYLPYTGNRIGLITYPNWTERSFSTPGIGASITSGGIGIATGSPILTGISNTVQMVRGMSVTGAGIGVGAVISSINSTSQVTLSVNSTSSTPTTATFACPAGKIYDILGVDAGGGLQLRFSNAWSSDSTRQDVIGRQDGVDVNLFTINSGDSNAITSKCGVLLGTIRIGTADGLMDQNINGDAVSSSPILSISNRYNRVPTTLSVYDSTDSWLYTSTVSRAANGSSNARIQIVSCVVQEIAELINEATSNNATTSYGSVGIGINSTSSNSANSVTRIDSATSTSVARLSTYPPIGYNYYSRLESSQATGTRTWYGDGGIPNLYLGIMKMVVYV